MEQAKETSYVHLSGLTRSHKAPGYHQIPPEALECLADRFDLGKARRTPGTTWYENKEKSLADPDFYLQTLNNAQEHLSKLMNGDFSEDDEWGHLGAIMWMCAVRAWRYRRLTKPADPYALRCSATCVAIPNSDEEIKRCVLDKEHAGPHRF